MKFKLSVEFSAEDCQRLHKTNSSIAIAKPDGSGKPNVAWVVFDPMKLNCIEWREEYGIYASKIEIQCGAKITNFFARGISAIEGSSYELEASGMFSGELEAGGTPHAFTIKNEYNNLTEDSRRGYLTMGLTQNATVNGEEHIGNPVSAAPVLYKSTAVITPSTTVYIWTQSNIVSNTVITSVHSQMTRVVFADDTTAISLSYNAESGRFLPKNGI